MGMKNLKDTVLEKLKVDDIILGEKFPLDGTLEDMCEFLEEQGFNSLKSPKDRQFDTIFGVFNSRPAGKYYMLKTKPIPCIMFMSKKSGLNISPTQPLYEVVDVVGGRLYLMNYSLFCYDEVSKQAFIQKLNKRFGWK